MTDRLHRSREDRMLAGVAGGLAEQLDADPSIIRILWVLVAILSGGIAVIVYIAMAIIVPEEDGADRWPPGTATEAGTTASAVAAGATDPSPPASAGPPLDGTGWVAPAPRPRRPRRQGDGGRRGAIVFGLILVLIGAYLLIREFAPAVDLGLAWPIASIVLGVVLVILSIRPKRASS